MPTEGVSEFDDLVYGKVTVPNNELEDQILRNKNFDYSIRCPKELYSVEDRIRDLLKAYISRGKV